MSSSDSNRSNANKEQEEVGNNNAMNTNDTNTIIDSSSSSIGISSNYRAFELFFGVTQENGVNYEDGSTNSNVEEQVVLSLIPSSSVPLNHQPEGESIIINNKIENDITSYVPTIVTPAPSHDPNLIHVPTTNDKKHQPSIDVQEKPSFTPTAITTSTQQKSIPSEDKITLRSYPTIAPLLISSSSTGASPTTNYSVVSSFPSLMKSTTPSQQKNVLLQKLSLLSNLDPSLENYTTTTKNTIGIPYTMFLYNTTVTPVSLNNDPSPVPSSSLSVTNTTDVKKPIINNNNKSKLIHTHPSNYDNSNNIFHNSIPSKISSFTIHPSKDEKISTDHLHSSSTSDIAKNTFSSLVAFNTSTSLLVHLSSKDNHLLNDNNTTASTKEVYSSSISDDIIEELYHHNNVSLDDYYYDTNHTTSTTTTAQQPSVVVTINTNNEKNNIPMKGEIDKMITAPTNGSIDNYSNKGTSPVGIALIAGAFVAGISIIFILLIFERNKQQNNTTKRSTEHSTDNHSNNSNSRNGEGAIFNYGSSEYNADDEFEIEEIECSMADADKGVVKIVWNGEEKEEECSL